MITTVSTDNATDNSTEDENLNNTEDDTNNSTDNDDTVAGVIWKTLTPRSKGKVKANLKNQILPRGLSYAVRKAVNVNLCNKLIEHVPYSSKLCTMVEEFFDDVSRLCPDKMKVVKDSKPVPWRHCIASLLRKMIIAHINILSVMSLFTLKSLLHLIGEPAKCKMCLNPELKVERLVRLGKLSKCNYCMMKFKGLDLGLLLIMKGSILLVLFWKSMMVFDQSEFVV